MNEESNAKTETASSASGADNAQAKSENGTTEAERIESHYKDLITKATAEAAAFKRNAAEYKAKYESTLTEQQRADAAREEADKALREEVASLRRDKEISDIRASFIGSSLPDKTATALAEALADGNKTEFVKLFGEAVAELKKNAKYESYKESPKPGGNNGAGEVDEALALAKALGEKRAKSADRKDILKNYL